MGAPTFGIASPASADPKLMPISVPTWVRAPIVVRRRWSAGETDVIGPVSRAPETRLAASTANTPSSPAITARTRPSPPRPRREPFGRVRAHPREVPRHGGRPQRAVVPDEPSVGALLGPAHDAVAALAAQLEQHDHGVPHVALRDHEPLAGPHLDGRQ